MYAQTEQSGIDSNGYLDENPVDLLAECRRRFFAEYRAQIETGKFAVEDIRRVRTEDMFVLQFIRRCNNDIDVTLPVLVESLKWRLSFGVNKLNVLDVHHLLEKQVMYIHGQDLESQALLWFNVRNHRKDSSENDGQKMIVFWLEKFTREEPGKPLVIIFDMTSSGLQNMDLDLIKFLLNCLKYHFPGLLAYLMVYEIPWILNAAWKLIKSWLDPAAQKKILFVDRKVVEQYIHPSNLPVHMGGTDDYRLELSHVGDRERKEMTPLVEQDVWSLNSQVHPDDIVIRRRNVHFAPHPPEEQEAEPEDEEEVHPTLSSSPLASPDIDVPLATVSQQSQRALSLRARELAELREHSGDPSHVTSMLSISPKEELVMMPVDNEKDRVDVIVLKHIGEGPVAFKIKTTSPEKFRVRPSGGLIRSGKSIVKIYLASEYMDTVYKEKFLILSLRLPSTRDYDDLSAEDLAAIWKRAPKADIDEHRLRCRLGDSMHNVSVTMPHPSASVFKLPTPSDPLLVNMAQEIVELRKETGFLRKLLLILCSLMLVLLLHQRLCFQHISDQIAK